MTPAGAEDRQGEAAADVFFLHPTTYFSGESWNQPLDDPETNRRTDERVLRNQASAFNGAGRVFAPRYRQATLGAFFTDDTADADAARALAYSDVRRAFRHYLAEWGGDRPLVIAAHSQGSRMALRLLSEHFAGDAAAAGGTAGLDVGEGGARARRPAAVPARAGPPVGGPGAAVDRGGAGVSGAPPALRRRLVAAYLVGVPLPEAALEETLPGLPLCRSAEQTGCVVTWNSVEAGARPQRLERPRVWFPDGPRVVDGRGLLCVNPVSWRADGSRTARDAHLGAVRFGEGDGEDHGGGEGDGGGDGGAAPRPVRYLLTARCRQGLLEVELSEDFGPGVLGEDYHLLDYSLFYMDVRRNVARRVEAFLEARDGA